jgi:hypothetical protein
VLGSVIGTVNVTVAPAAAAGCAAVASKSGAPVAASTIATDAVPAAALALPVLRTATTTESQAVVVEKQAVSGVSDHRQVRKILHHCLIGTLRNDGFLPPFGIPAPLAFGHVPPPFGDLELQSVGMVSDAADQASQSVDQRA